eukprot:CAMPEP_0114360226 /NCGR_PEP_ID=MMETSP0101-20121206/23671_1 /TAXON_ID=38822 ORGANISM="Pteridomonas danica, Strain PT" /NCGR_SAMPLE_ID=MMETSP0101 /ASSEMBLY_ACC=CAM_ASM_000211 /LENGTH=280 /DNA_ID=CAMNT_0001504289 /DNA_START=94 /DNA_END=936 /DNA_ORIENTATION=+
MPHQDNLNEGNGEIPLFVRGTGGSGFHNNSYDDNDHDSIHQNMDGSGSGGNDSMLRLKDYQRKLSESISRADEAQQLNIVLEQDLQAHATKRMTLERELNDVHREHINEMATQKAEYEILKNDYEKLHHLNLKLREELWRTNRELMGVLAKKNEFKKDAERAARNAITDEQRAKAELSHQQNQNHPNNHNPLIGRLHSGGHNNSGHDLLQGHRDRTNSTTSTSSSTNFNDIKSLRNKTPTPPKLRGLGGSSMGFSNLSNDDPRAIRSGNALRDLNDFFDM